MHRRIVGPLLLLLPLLLVPEAWGAVRYVAKSGTDWNALSGCTQSAPCATIHQAVVIASPGDTISIGKGKFVEPYGVTVNKNLTITGAGIFSTRVYGGPGHSIFSIGLGDTVSPSPIWM